MKTDLAIRKQTTAIVKGILNPRHIALLGASNQPGKVGYVCLKNLLEGFQGKVYPIHPHEKEILGVPAYLDLEDVPNPVDLAFIIVPAESVLPILKQCGKKKVPGAIVITAGFPGHRAELLWSAKL